MAIVLSIAYSVFFLPSLVHAELPASRRPVMMDIEGGTYLRGSLEQPYATTERVHETTVSPFRLSAYETTQALWREIMVTNPARFRGDKLPVDSVSWIDAVRFCNVLSERDGLETAYEIRGNDAVWRREANGYRLPTEAEWEFAARGGVRGAISGEPLRKVLYAGGSDADKVAWYDRNSAKTSHETGIKLANELGLFDMSGNVWEWCWDWYGDYPRTAVKDPEGAIKGAGQKVLRGGAWFTPINLLRVTYRYWNAPTFKVNSVGFRLAQNATAAANLLDKMPSGNDLYSEEASQALTF